MNAQELLNQLPAGQESELLSLMIEKAMFTHYAQCEDYKNQSYQQARPIIEGAFMHLLLVDFQHNYYTQVDPKPKLKAVP